VILRSPYYIRIEAADLLVFSAEDLRNRIAVAISKKHECEFVPVMVSEEIGRLPHIKLIGHTMQNPPCPIMKRDGYELNHQYDDSGLAECLDRLAESIVAEDETKAAGLAEAAIERLRAEQ